MPPVRSDSGAQIFNSDQSEYFDYFCSISMFCIIAIYFNLIIYLIPKETYRGMCSVGGGRRA